MGPPVESGDCIRDSTRYDKMPREMHQHGSLQLQLLRPHHGERRSTWARRGNRTQRRPDSKCNTFFSVHEQDHKFKGRTTRNLYCSIIIIKFAIVQQRAYDSALVSGSTRRRELYVKPLERSQLANSLQTLSENSSQIDDRLILAPSGSYIILIRTE